MLGRIITDHLRLVPLIQFRKDVILIIAPLVDLGKAWELDLGTIGTEVNPVLFQVDVHRINYFRGHLTGDKARTNQTV